MLYVWLGFLALGLSTLFGAVVFPHRFRRGLRRLISLFQTLHRRTRGEHPMRRGAVRLIITATGLLILLVGIPLVPLPGPGWLTIFVGLGLLSLEFRWARDLLQGLRNLLVSLFDRVVQSGWKPPWLGNDFSVLIPDESPSSDSSG